jgi:hypothetical protein
VFQATDGKPFYCGKNEIQASLISSASVGATPTPATISKTRNPKSETRNKFEIRNSNFLWEAIRLLDCKSSVIKYVSEETNWSVTSASHHFENAERRKQNEERIDSLHFTFSILKSPFYGLP